MMSFSEFRRQALARKRASRAIPLSAPLGYRDEDIDAHRAAVRKVDWNRVMIEGDRREPFAIAS